MNCREKKTLNDTIRHFYITHAMYVQKQERLCTFRKENNKINVTTTYGKITFSGSVFQLNDFQIFSPPPKHLLPTPTQLIPPLHFPPHTTQTHITPLLSK